MSKKLNTLSDVWYDAFGLIKKWPRLLFPLSIVSFLEALWLETIYFSIRSPLNAFFRPSLKRFFGEMNLHYPAFLLTVVPRLFGRGQILIYVFIGGVLTAVTIALAGALSEGRPFTLGAAWKKVGHRFLTLIAVSAFITFSLFFVTSREILLFKAGFNVVGRGPLLRILVLLVRISPFLNFFIAIAVQSFVLFIFPLLILENKKVFRAVWESFVLGWKHFLRIYGLLLLPMVCYGPIWFLKENTFFLVRRMPLYPEVNLWILGVGILATLFVDTFVAVCAALYFLRLKK